MIKLLAGASQIDFITEKPAKSIGAVGTGFEAFLLIEGGINAEQLAARFRKELENEKNFLVKVEAKLSGKFAQNAPADIVAAEREKRDNAQRRIEKLTSYLQSL